MALYQFQKQTLFFVHEQALCAVSSKSIREKLNKSWRKVNPALAIYNTRLI